MENKIIVKEVKYHPIPFSTEMVRAILDGRKTQTRRVIKPQPTYEGASTFGGDITIGFYCYWKTHKVSNIQHLVEYYPYGQVGDRLWVRESYGYLIDNSIAYRANCNDWHLKNKYTIKWKPSIFMPRWASRIDLEIIDVRVERVQEITYEDIIAEGMKPRTKPISNFRKLWDSLNAKRGYGWGKNPWVWVIEFKVLEKK